MRLVGRIIEKDKSNISNQQSTEILKCRTFKNCYMCFNEKRRRTHYGCTMCGQPICLQCSKQTIFLKKNTEAYSLARANAFNKHTVQSFFTNLKLVMERHECFGNGCRVYNLDETASTTVQKPQKVLAPKGRQNIC